MVMMRNLLPIVMCVCFITSCASVPPPRIENGFYINPSYEYSIKLPPGWVQKEDIPDWLKSGVPYNFIDNIKIIFFNNETNGMIVVANDKSVIDLQNVNKKQLSDALKKALECEIEKIKNNPYIENISYEVYEPSSIITPELITVTEGVIATEFMKLTIENNGFIYVCENDDSCIFSISLISLSSTFTENEKTFKEIISSLEKLN